MGPMPEGSPKLSGDSRIGVALAWLNAAIERHERHMNGTEPTAEASQMQMMVEMKNARKALAG